MTHQEHKEIIARYNSNSTEISPTKKIENESGEIMRILIKNPELIVVVQRVIKEKLKESL